MELALSVSVVCDCFEECRDAMDRIDQQTRKRRMLNQGGVEDEESEEMEVVTTKRK